MSTTLTISRAQSPDDAEWANSIYADINFQQADPDNDIILIARDGDDGAGGGQRIGAGRLIPVGEGAVELAGIYTDPQKRGKGVAGEIINELLRQSRPIARTVYCLPFDYLEGFYRGFGFMPREVRDDDPEPIRKKLEWCAESQEVPVILMEISR